MSFACGMLASFLLIFIFSTKGAPPQNITVQGTLDHDINLNIPDLQMDNIVDEIQWKKNETWIVRYQRGKMRYQLKETYEVLTNGTLKIKHLKRNDSGTYKVTIYNMDGKCVLERIFDLRILERVSKPVISWSCTNTTLTCEVTKGTDPQLRLYQNGNNIGKGHKVIIHKRTNSNASFQCVANNEVSEETSTVAVRCPEKSLDIYLIIGICGGGVIFFAFVALLILYISKRKKQSRRRNGEEVEIRAHRITSEERSRKPHRIPGSAPPNPAASQPPPPPDHHRPPAPGHRPPPPGHRVQHQHHQQQQRSLPPPGTQAQQQKGPPLPRPRVQAKSPRGATENS